MDISNASDIDAFEEIVDRFSDRLFRVAFMRVGVRETAEDIVQDVFLRLFRTISQGREIRSYEYFLLRSVSNACIDQMRRKKPPTLQLEEIPDLADIPDRDIDEEFRRVSRLLDGLPLEQAETLRMKCYDGLTFRQIAEIHEIPEATVKSRYRYAIRQIKQKLERER